MHMHWSFLAYNDADVTESNSQTVIHKPVEVSVVGFSTESDARDAARGIVRRDHCLLQRVFECTTCAFQARMADAVSEIGK